MDAAVLLKDLLPFEGAFLYAEVRESPYLCTLVTHLNSGGRNPGHGHL